MRALKYITMLRQYIMVENIKYEIIGQYIKLQKFVFDKV